MNALFLARPYVAEFHFCNCVMDPSHRLYGDYHIPFGKPGILDITGIAAMLRNMLKMEFMNKTDRPSLMCEVLKQEQADSVELMFYCKDIFSEAWDMIRHDQLLTD
jgi:hypothetical protein